MYVYHVYIYLVLALQCCSDSDLRTHTLYIPSHIPEIPAPRQDFKICRESPRLDQPIWQGEEAHTHPYILFNSEAGYVCSLPRNLSLPAWHAPVPNTIPRRGALNGRPKILPWKVNPRLYKNWHLRFCLIISTSWMNKGESILRRTCQTSEMEIFSLRHHWVTLKMNRQ